MDSRPDAGGRALRVCRRNRVTTDFHQCDIVLLAITALKPFQLFQNTGDPVVSTPAQLRLKTFSSEHLPVLIDGFNHTVGIKADPVPLANPEFLCR